ncbi:MAG: class I SAM-dependent methyltransferase [bacterium]
MQSLQFEQSISLLQKNGYNIFRCIDCRSAFLDINENFFNFESFYQSYYKIDEKQEGYDNYFALENALKLTFQQRLNSIKKYFDNDPKEKKLLDIGCGPGFFLEESSKFFKSFGIEISKTAANYIKNKLNLNVINKAFSADLFKTEEFDVITCWDTLEHLQNPEKALSDINKILNKKGLLIFTTGDFASIPALITGKKWHLFNVPEHLFFFSKNGIIHLLKKTGFKPIHISYPFAYYSLEYIAERIRKTFGVRIKLLPFFKKIIIPFNLFDIMCVICKKNDEFIKQ